MKATLENIKERIQINPVVNIEFGNGRRATLLLNDGTWCVQGRGDLGDDSKLETILKAYEAQTGKEAIIIK